MQGYTLAEIIVAGALSVIVLVGIVITHGACLRLVKSHRETLAANEILQNRFEAMRRTNWSMITRATAIRDEVLNTPAPNSGTLHNLREEITVAPYPPVTPNVNPIKVRRDSSGVTIISQPPVGLSLRALLALRVDVRLTWDGTTNGKPRVRESSTVVSLSGLLR